MLEKSTENTVVVIDGGGRGAVLVDKYAQSEHVKRIIAVPGNDLMGINNPDKEVVIFKKLNGKDLKTTSVSEILEICEKEKVDLVDVAQDNAVEVGLTDTLVQKGITVVGPERNPGRIEWDKAWARLFGEKHGLPQPFFKIFHTEQDAIDFLKKEPNQPWFVKAAGLAEGKGALPAESNEEAMKRVSELRQKFKDASKTFLLEKWLRNDDGSPGEEFSTFVFVTGRDAESLDYRIIGSAQDHKRVNNFDDGENTGGMGCSSPPLLLTPELMEDIKVNILDKTIEGFREENILYKGVLYLGGIVIKENEKLKAYVVEFNSRWGDPEAEVILPGLTNDLFEIGMAIAHKDIGNLDIKTDGKARIVVAGASKGYPGDYSQVKGKQIYGINEARQINEVKVYGAGVREENKKYLAYGGRLIYVVGPRNKVYEAMSKLFVEGNNLHYRTDIGWRDEQRRCVSLAGK